MLTTLLGFCLAQAGHYDPTVTTGLRATSSIQGNINVNYSYGTASVSVGSAGHPASGSITGNATTKYTWIPDKDANGNTIPWDVAPPAIVMQACSTTSQATCYPAIMPTAIASNGLDSRFCTNSSSSTFIYNTSPPYQPIGAQANAASSGTAPNYVQPTVDANGVATITVNCPINVAASTTTGPVNLTCNYSVAVYPVQLNITSIVHDGGGAYGEVSRSNSAWLSLSGADSLPSPVAPANFQWAIGGEAFKDYIHRCNGCNAEGYVVDLGASDLTQKIASWVWKGIKTQNASVSVTEDLYYLGIKFASAAAGQTVKVEAATPLWTGLASNCSTSFHWGLRSDGNPSVVFGGETWGVLYWFGAQPCQHFTGAIVFPVQLVTAAWLSSTPLGTYGWVNTGGNYWLDSSYPYDMTTTANGAQQEDADRPIASFTICNSWSVRTNFELYLMYTTGDTVVGADVPMLIQFWDWNGESDQTTYSTPTWEGAYPYDTHPTWQNVLVSGTKG